MGKVYCGIDNGVSGSIGVFCEKADKEYMLFYPTPTIECQDYTKKLKRLRRIDVHKMTGIFETAKAMDPEGSYLAVIERPFVNPGMFNATLSSVRCLEATLIILESLKIPYMFIDSKQWQKDLLPAGCQKEQLKIASRDIGIRTFPEYKEQIEKQKDADSILIALWAHRMGL